MTITERYIFVSIFQDVATKEEEFIMTPGAAESVVSNGSTVEPSVLFHKAEPPLQVNGVSFKFKPDYTENTYI